MTGQAVVVSAVKKYTTPVLKRLSGESGFSLIELVIMVAILGITLIPLTSLSISSIRNTGRQIERTRAIMYAEEGVEYVWSFYANTNTGAGYQGILDGNLSFSGLNSDLESGFSRTYAVSAEQTLHGIDFVNLTVTVGCPTAGDVDMTIMLTEI